MVFAFAFLVVKGENMNLLLFNIWSKVKSYLIYILGVVALCCICFCRCNTLLPKNVITVPKLVSQKVLAKIQKEVPTAIKAETFVPEKANLGEKVKDIIVTKKDGSIVVLQKQVAQICFKHDLGLYVGASTQLNYGLCLDLIQIQRCNIGTLAGYPWSAGIDINYMIWNNTSLGAAYIYNSLGIPSPLIFVKLNF